MVDSKNSSSGSSDSSSSSSSSSKNDSKTPPVSAVPFGQPSGLEVTIKSLLEAGAHFGHQTSRWNPKMAQYIFGEKNGVHIINLDDTMKCWIRARKYLVDTLCRGGNVLFVGTKQQARDLVESEGRRCGAHFVNRRWLGGCLTNFETIRRSIERMRKLEDYLTQSELPDSKIKLHKKEKLSISKELEKLGFNLGGIRMMKRIPDILFVVDTQKEAIAVAEARRLRIPVVALVDTNCDPAEVDFPIPSNDDAAKTLHLFISCVADAVIEGRSIYEARAAARDAAKKEQAAPAAAQGSSESETAVSL